MHHDLRTQSAAGLQQIGFDGYAIGGGSGGGNEGGGRTTLRPTPLATSPVDGPLPHAHVIGPEGTSVRLWG